MSELKETENDNELLSAMVESLNAVIELREMGELEPGYVVSVEDMLESTGIHFDEWNDWSDLSDDYKDIVQQSLHSVLDTDLNELEPHRLQKPLRDDEVNVTRSEFGTNHSGFAVRESKFDDGKVDYELVVITLP